MTSFLRTLKAICLFGIFALFAGCNSLGGSDVAEENLVNTEAVEDVIIEVGEVIFDGTECAVSGLTELPPGRYSYVLKDLSEDDVNLFVGRLTEGMTFQDLLDLQDEPEGRVAFIDDLLDWAVEPGVEWQKPDGGEVHTYILTEEGEYAVGLWSWATENTPIWVKETPSD